MTTTERTKLAEGKTKIIWRAPGEYSDNEVEIESKDDITAGDGASHDLLEGKAVAATTTTCHLFELLESKGIQTHYLRKTGDRTFRAHQVTMIPLELVVRRVATGSYLKRNPDAVEGEMFDDLIFEIFHKDDAAHDPILDFEPEIGEAIRYPAGEPDPEPMDSIPISSLNLGNDPEAALEELEHVTRQVFEVIEEAWSEQDVQLVDLKIECGWTAEGHLVVADVIDNDSWRIWPAGDKTRQMDKQVYRELADVEDPKAKAKELGQIKKNYQWVAEATGKFVS